PLSSGDYSVTEAGGTANGNPGDPGAGGTLQVVDADAGQSNFQVPPSLNGTYGTFAFDELTGAWTYTLDNSRTAIQGLDSGESQVDTLTVKSFDGSATYNINVTVNGADDQPTLVGPAAGSVAEINQSSSTN